jgi:L,D-peptidoglycan transpeptidase YkuD (ErfK/YbiS/YcfS/YnhG family)
MDLIVKSERLAVWGNNSFRCAIGVNGFSDPINRKEGDGTTPIGRWVMREVFYRADRIKPPETALPVRALKPTDGWSGSTKGPILNGLVTCPYNGTEESLWRDDNLYDIVVVLGFNDDPPALGKGSAIFLHIARPDFSPSAGCVHLSREDLLTVLHEADRNSAVLVSPAP